MCVADRPTGAGSATIGGVPSTTLDMRGFSSCLALSAHVRLLADSHLRLTGRALIDTSADDTLLAQHLWDAPFVLLSHGTEPDPVFNYANRAAQTLFEHALIGLPSRLSAEAPLREARARLLERVHRDGYIDDYAGVRVSASGRRFRIEQATVWNVVDAAGWLHGQAAAFSRWIEL